MLPSELNTLQDDPLDEGENTANGTGRLVSWLVILSMALAFLPLYLVSATLKELRPTLEAELTLLQSTLAATPAPNGTQDALNAQLLLMRQDAALLDAVNGTLVAKQINWSEKMGIINTINTEQMTITTLTQRETTVMLVGKADDEATVMAYIQYLRDTGQFNSVTLQSINLDMAVLAQTPAPPADPALVTPGAPTATPTPRPKPANFTLIIELKGLAADGR